MSDFSSGDAAFSSGDAAFEGFRLTREAPRVVLTWALFHLIVSFVSATALILLGGDSLLQAENAAEMTPAEMAVFMRDMAPAYLTLAPIGPVSYTHLTLPTSDLV